MLSSDVGFPLEHAAPLPWFPPQCPRYEAGREDESALDSLASMARLLRSPGSPGSAHPVWGDDKVPERELEEAFDRSSPERNFHEWGARVTAAMNQVGDTFADLSTVYFPLVHSDIHVVFTFFI